MARIRFAPLLAAAVLSVPLLPGAAAQDTPPPAGTPPTETKEKKGEQTGVVVHGTLPPAARARAELGPGVTVATPPPAGTPVVRVITERVREIQPLPVPRPEQPPVRFGLTPSLAPLGGAPQLPSAKTIGPNEREQQAAFGRPAVTAAGPIRPASTWTPVSAYEYDRRRPPYPWNPAEFSRSVFDPVWTPTPAWPPGQDERNWSPVVWPNAIIDWTFSPGADFGGSVSEGVEDTAVGAADNTADEP